MQVFNCRNWCCDILISVVSLPVFSALVKPFKVSP